MLIIYCERSGAVCTVPSPSKFMARHTATSFVEHCETASVLAWRMCREMIYLACSQISVLWSAEPWAFPSLCQLAFPTQNSQTDFGVRALIFASCSGL